jgi:glutaredoxin 3
MTNPPEVLIYSTNVCPYCVAAKALLEKKGVSYREINVENDPAERQRMMERTGRRTVPQIYIGDRHVGGFDELAVLDMRGELDTLLRS